MYKGFYNLTSAMLTEQKRLDIISNNMANVATPGYKSQILTSTTFKEVMWSLTGNKNKDYTDVGNQSFITVPSDLVSDLTQMPLEETGLSLDFSIEGDGFFAIETDDGRMYTRNGNFTLDEEGNLSLSGYGTVLDQNGAAISLPTDRIVVDSSGRIFTENGNYLGIQIGVFDFADRTALLESGQGFFMSEEEGTAAENAVVRQSMLEASNVDWAKSLTEMITAQRAFQSAAEVIRIYDGIINHDTQDVGRLA